MSASLTIGEFSRLTHLTVKTLRHYDEQGLLVPYAVDEATDTGATLSTRSPTRC